MGPGYLAWKHRVPAPNASAPEITQEQRKSFHRPPEWPHPRLRAIEKLAPAEKRHGITPAPKRSQGTSWKDFIATHLAVLAGADVFTVEVLT
jgi:hypothetical protein